MTNPMKYIVGGILALSTIYCATRGLVVGLRKPSEVMSHRNQAIFLTVSTLLGLASFELFYPTSAGLICLPIVLTLIWVEYMVAVWQIRRFKK